MACVQLAVSVLAVLVLSRVIEPVYGSKEYLKFIMVVSAFAVSGTRDLLHKFQPLGCQRAGLAV